MKGLMILIAITLFTLTNSFSQEICNNGKDDDGDGLVDINDPLCQCHFNVTGNLLKNGSFESYNNCPSSYTYTTDAKIIDHWQYGTYTNFNEATFYHNLSCTNDSSLVMLYQPPALPLPEGKGFVAIRQSLSPGDNIQEKDIAKVYISQCLQQPLKAGKQYTLSFSAGRFKSNDDANFIHKEEPFTVAIFGQADCAAVPFGPENAKSNGCPLNFSGWELLGKVVVYSKGEWVQSKITFIAPFNVNVIEIGPDCTVPKPDINLTDGTTFLDYYVYYLDDLHLLPTQDFNFSYINGYITNSCELDTLLHAPVLEGAKAYQWYKNNYTITGATNAILSIEQSVSQDIYIVKIETADSCVVSEPFVAGKNSLSRLRIPADTFICTGDSLLLAPAIDGIIYTVDGAVNSSVEILKQGFYNISAIDMNGCSRPFSVSVAEQNCNIYLPNVFTPNGDGLNDVFRIPQAGVLRLKDFSIYDRWGNQVFYTTNGTAAWDGTFKGKESPAGTYIYNITGSISGNKKHFKGTIVLAR
ncbi:MAG: gliding motility-associated C-terminal domain-containing protein [Ginsengibacter sp.]